MAVARREHERRRIVLKSTRARVSAEAIPSAIARFREAEALAWSRASTAAPKSMSSAQASLRPSKAALWRAVRRACAAVVSQSRATPAERLPEMLAYGAWRVAGIRTAFRSSSFLLSFVARRRMHSM